MLAVGLMVPALALAEPAGAAEGSPAPDGAPTVCDQDTVDMVYSETGTSSTFVSMWIPAGANAKFVASGEILAHLSVEWVRMTGV